MARFTSTAIRRGPRPSVATRSATVAPGATARGSSLTTTCTTPCTLRRTIAPRERADNSASRLDSGHLGLIFLGLLVHSRIDISGRPTVAEVSLSALRHNCRRARELSGPDVAVMAVVKADAYGHGAVPAARAFLDAGAQALGVSSVAEAVELRRAGLAGALLVLGGAFPGEEETVVAQDLAVALWDADQARALAGAARTAGRQVAVHLKVDTGMTRLGLDLADLSSFAALVRGLGELRVEGVFSHFASADAVETAAARAQTGRFVGAVEALVAAGLRPPEVHLANSAAVLAAPEARFTMVRPGIMLYGYSPAPHLAARAAVRPAMRLRTRVAQVRRVPQGTPVG